MITPKEYYRNYLADDKISMLNIKLMDLITACHPTHVLEFGCGTGKNLRLISDYHPEMNIECTGIDISLMGLIHARTRHDVPFILCGDETHLRHLCNFDIVFTCSVLDHIENIEGIIQEFKRIANKNIILMETNDVPGQYYYPHNYEAFGFTKLAYEYLSEGDGARYHIWMFNKIEA